MNMTICDAYSGGCTSPQPSVSASPSPKPKLPVTGPTGGDVVTSLLLAVLLILVGIGLVYAAKRVR